MKNRIGIDPSGTGTTAIAIYDDKGELKLESFKSDD
jgi:predicted NBD/HSP70 family sugar kinase